MSTIISAVKQARRSSVIDVGGSHGFGHSLPVRAAMATAPAESANAAAAALAGVAAALPTEAGHESGGASAGSEEDSEASSGTSSRRRKLPVKDVQVKTSRVIGTV